MTDEPEALRRGKAFHTDLQASWRQRHGGESVHPEHGVTTATGAGRMDLLVDITTDGSSPDGPNPFHAVIELKDRDFDRMSRRNLRAVVRRDRRQVLRYVQTLIDLESSEEARSGESWVMPAVAYGRSPSDPEVRTWIESTMDEDMIAVIWEDESIEQAKERLG